MTPDEAITVLDFTGRAHADLYIRNRMVGDSICLQGVFTAEELEAIVALMRDRT